MSKCHDKVILETYIPDGSMSCTFNKASTEYCHMIKRSDLSVVMVQSSGLIQMVTSNARAALNELGTKEKLGSEADTDYL